MKRREGFKKRIHTKSRIHNQTRSGFLFLNLFKNVNIFKYLSIFLIFLFILSIPAVIKRLIKIDKIECSSQFGPCVRPYQLGDYNFVKTQIKENLDNDIQVSSYLIQYKIPSTVKIDLVLKKPRYAIRDLSGKYFLIDKEGVVLDITEQTDLFYITSNVNYSVGQKISDGDRFSLNLIEKNRIVNSVNTAEIKDDVLEVRIENGILVKFPLEGDIDVLIGSLRLIFSRLNEGSQGIRMEDVTEIDLRFKNPVLR